MELKKVLMSRKSCRAYTDKPVEAEKLEAVVTSASLAPLGVPRMGKPHLTIVTNKEMLKTLGYQGGPERDAIYGAPVLIIVSCPESYPGIAEMNAACVVEMMSLAATDLGLGNIYLYGVCAQLQKNEALQKEIGIPENMKPLSALGLGYGEEPIAECKAFEKVLTENYIA
ncbi:MAG: nitroreductase family protein [Firmicutes bacterium]|nr:nitroreductase family protein [Bacillota bacterium]